MEQQTEASKIVSKLNKIKGIEAKAEKAAFGGGRIVAEWKVESVDSQPGMYRSLGKEEAQKTFEDAGLNTRVNEYANTIKATFDR